jgi:hypothetical protein
MKMCNKMDVGLGSPFILPASTIVYRRNSKPTVEHKPGRLFWCSLDEPGGMYGPWRHKFEFAKDLRLFNVATAEFREGCKAAIDSIPGLSDQQREMMYLPFGLAGFVQTKRALDASIIGGKHPVLKKLSPDTQRKLFGQFDGCMRTSLTTVDRGLMEFLRDRFGEQYDGYIAPMAMPGLLHGEFPPEICLFAPNEAILKHIESKAVPPGYQMGGGDEHFDDIELWAQDGSLTTYVDQEVVEPMEVYHDIQLAPQAGGRVASNAVVVASLLAVVVAGAFA